MLKYAYKVSIYIPYKKNLFKEHLVCLNNYEYAIIDIFYTLNAVHHDDLVFKVNLQLIR